jgi:hypothetical protein
MWRRGRWRGLYEREVWDVEMQFFWFEDIVLDGKSGRPLDYI